MKLQGLAFFKLRLSEKQFGLLGVLRGLMTVMIMAQKNYIH